MEREHLVDRELAPPAYACHTLRHNESRPFAVGGGTLNVVDTTYARGSGFSLTSSLGVRSVPAERPHTDFRLKPGPSPLPLHRPFRYN
jgi:hypothetical protein